MSFARETPVRAVRKRKRCDGCGKHVEIGEPAIRWAGLTDGDFGTAIYHPDCRAAEIALNRLVYLNWDEWANLDEIDEEDWPWLVEKHPTVAARMGITLPTSAEHQSGEAVQASSAQDEPNFPSRELAPPDESGDACGATERA